MKKHLKLITLCLSLTSLITFLSSCEKDLYEDAFVENKKQTFTFEYVYSKEAEYLKDDVLKQIKTYREANRDLDEPTYGTIMYDEVMKVVDNMGNKTFMFRVEHPDATNEKFYNMVLQEKTDGRRYVKLFEYVMTPDFAEKYYSGLKELKEFEGSYSYKLLANTILDPRYNGDYDGEGPSYSGGSNDGNTGTPTGSAHTTPGSTLGGNNNSSGVGSLSTSSVPCITGGGPLSGGGGGASGSAGSGGGLGSEGSSSCFIMVGNMHKVYTSSTCYYDITYLYVDCNDIGNRGVNSNDGTRNRSTNDADPCSTNNNGVTIFQPANAPGIFNYELNYLTGSPTALNTFIALSPEVKSIVYNYIAQSSTAINNAATFFSNLYHNNQLTWYAQQSVGTQINILNYVISNNFSQQSQIILSQIINQIIQNPNLNFNSFWYNRSDLDTNAATDLDNNEIGNYDENTYSDFDLQQNPWPTIQSVIPVNQFIGWGTPNINRNCMDYAKAQIAQLGYKISNYNAPGQTFQIYREQTGVNQTKLQQGVSYLVYALSNGIPVIVGVDDKVGVPLAHDGTPGNADLTTDHFIVIVGMGSNSNGNYFQFYDNASGSPTQGANSLNLLYYNPSTGIISGQSQTSYSQGSNMHDYIITQIRKSK